MKEYCGTTNIEGKEFTVFTENNQFKLFDGGRFVKYIANSILRKSGIYGEKGKKIYGKYGYVGTLPKAPKEIK